ncbi:hypothetical protein IWZ03DRAFT_391200 [Phyllosticta citriasiana]|uniref:Zn(2)-C6 fungal-type domain-containing protein n=1 Tax=Phyllosticta citriasiana TaxID=595635 RepID=A0ABR1K733_9PEZI
MMIQFPFCRSASWLRLADACLLCLSAVLQKRRLSPVRRRHPSTTASSTTSSSQEYMAKMGSSPRTWKKARTACDECRRRKVRCRERRDSCDNCQKLGLECTYDGVTRRSLSAPPRACFAARGDGHVVMSRARFTALMKTMNELRAAAAVGPRPEDFATSESPEDVQQFDKLVLLDTTTPLEKAPATVHDFARSASSKIGHVGEVGGNSCKDSFDSTTDMAALFNPADTTDMPSNGMDLAGFFRSMDSSSLTTPAAASSDVATEQSSKASSDMTGMTENYHSMSATACPSSASDTNTAVGSSSKAPSCDMTDVMMEAFNSMNATASLSNLNNADVASSNTGKEPSSETSFDFADTMAFLDSMDETAWSELLGTMDTMDMDQVFV